ncbi:MAG: hypothetical protein Ct9H300mP24_3640 [Candidatus Neomarinimicrobiota bacterium]|nr:MAG: hypothetical protein Ct9H300mP24_3640 [Candidatus Neomarinimicrobiota bacterium]
MLRKKRFIFLRHNRKHALKNADVVITAGVPLDFRLGMDFPSILMQRLLP